MNTQFDQSSPVQPVSEYRGVGLSVTKKKKESGRRTEILVSNIGCMSVIIPKLLYQTKPRGKPLKLHSLSKCLHNFIGRALIIEDSDIY